MRFLDYLTFSLRTTIGTVVLIALTSPGAIEDLVTASIYSDFVPDGVWVSARHAWSLVL